MPCPSCGADSTGKFCASCGAPLPSAACSACRAPLAAGAKFCHRCGTSVGAPAANGTAGGNALPWSVAAIALLALIALAAGQRFARNPGTESTEQEFALGSATGRVPDISSLSPTQIAERLYDRVMSAAERGKVDSVQFFLPMAMQSYANLGPLTVDQRYDLGRLAEVAGDAKVASAQADTILRENSKHLLGLLLASRAARIRGDDKAAATWLGRLVAAEVSERKKDFPEYLLHRNDIDAALTEWRKKPK